MDIGHSPVLEKWYGTLVIKSNGEWNRTEKEIMLNFPESGHPVFWGISPFARGVLKSTGGRKSIDTLLCGISFRRTDEACYLGSEKMKNLLRPNLKLRESDDAVEWNQLLSQFRRSHFSDNVSKWDRKNGSIAFRESVTKQDSCFAWTLKVTFEKCVPFKDIS